MREKDRQACCGRRPEIDYPCIWQYRIIGSERARLDEAVGRCVGERSHRLAAGNTSSGGRYISLVLELEVASEEDRLELYRLLVTSKDVRMVL